MKKLLILLLLLSSTMVYAQETYNFIIKENKVLWQVVFNSNKEVKDIMSYFKSPIYASNNGIKWNYFDESAVSGKYEGKLDYRAIGYKWGSTAAYLNFFCNADVIVEAKENRYRVSVCSIEFFERPPVGGMELNTLAANNGEFRKVFLNNAAKIMNDIFLLKFHIKENTNEDW